MRALALIVTCSIVAVACTSRSKNAEQPWEYKVVGVFAEGHARTADQAGKPASVSPSEADLNALGRDGWEMVTSYLEMETAFPNFGDDKYVSGLQPNVRPQRVVFLFKRPLRKQPGE